METLSPLSAAFLQAEDEDPAASLAIGSLTVFEPPAPTFEEFAAAIRGRLPLLPRYRQRIQTVPGDLAPPVWVDDPSFDLDRHLRRCTLPAPGGRAELGRLMSRVMARRMDRSRPLWEYWFVSGLQDGRWALLSKLHHSLADGVSGADIYRLILDPGAEPTAPVADTWVPEPLPSTVSLALRGASHLAWRPVAEATALLSAARSPRRLLRRTGAAVRGLAAIVGAARPANPSSLVGPLDGRRRFAWTTVPFGDVRTVRERLGGTVNDVALAAISGGFRRLLLARGEEPKAHLVRSLVPVSVRAPGQESVRDNRVSLMLPYLPVDVDTGPQRLDAVRTRIAALQHAHEPEAGQAVTELAALGPFPPVSWGVRLAFHVPQRQVVTVTTNVPGPRTPLYALGRRAEEVIPYVPIADRVRVGVAIFSYCDTLTFGVTADHASVPDIDVLADGIADAMDELVLAARQAG